MELGRLLRRGLFVVAVAAAGWLLSAVFAGSAGAEARHDEQPHSMEQSSGGLLGGLLGGVTQTVTGLTDAVVGVTGSLTDTTTTLPVPVENETPEPVVEEPVSPPADDVTTGTAGTERVETPPPAPEPVAPAPVAPVRATAPVVAAAPKPAAAPVIAPRPAVAEEHDPAGDRSFTGSDPEPVKTPAGPSTPGTSVSAAHDHPGHARAHHGVLVTHTAPAHPADAGFTTRSRAMGAAGRDVGLPAATPD
ncbi:hypothetical protein [Actinophytocola sp. NPDC049390]|uniref:hypothetical protein n=1 Tax=Actinophytocola sp. NPDC049390 TaxID=3363894 RepID=UPI0037B55F6B